MARDKESSDEVEETAEETPEERLDADEITAEEEGFSVGYDSADREEEDTASDAYDQAFASKAKPKKRSKKDDDEDDEEFEDE